MSLEDTPTRDGHASVRLGWRALSLGATLAAALAAVWLARPAPITAIDQEQPRLNQAAPIPRGEMTVAQTFSSTHSGLSAVELLAVVQAGSPPAAPLRVRLLSADGRVVAAETLTGLAHNAPLRLTFPPQADSAGQMYTLVLEGGADNRTTAWAYSLDGYARGDLRVNGLPAAGDLRFSTRYTYLGSTLLLDAALGLARLARWALHLWLVLFAPGLLLLSLFRAGERFPASWLRWGLALAVSVTLAPLTWQWLTVFSLRWTPTAVDVAYGLAGAVVAVNGLRGWRVRRPRPSGHDLMLGVVLILGLVARLLAIRDLVLPAWVDSPHHDIIARLLAETGQVPPGYQPILPVAGFTYHFGFHALAVTFHWMTALTLEETMLLLGQVLNGLMPLAVYAFVVSLTRRPRAGLAAALFVGWVSLFPAYYVSWGRYTQLVGLLILAPLLGLTWQLVALERPGAPAQTAPRWLLTAGVGLLAGGLAFTHYRVLAFFVTFALVALAAGRAGGWKWLGAAGVVAGVLAAPWLWRLWQSWVSLAVSAPGSLASPAGYNDFPVAYFQGSLERGWLALAAVALVVGLVARDRAVWTISGWLALTFSLLNIGPGSWLVNNNAWAISLFVPGALLIGWGAERWWAAAEWLGQAAHGRLRRGLGALTYAALASLVVYASVRGLRDQVAVLNPATVLATADDRIALEWTDQNTPADAVFLTNSWLWQAGSWAGPDGGAWLWPLIGRRTTMPPVDYGYDVDWEPVVRTFNERLSRVTDADAPETLALLREAGVTHIFIGARGGVLRPEMFIHSPHYHLLYTNGAAWIFEFVPDRSG